MNSTPKATKRDVFNSMLQLIEAAKSAELAGFDYDGMTDTMTKEIASLDKKAEAAKTRAAKKKEEGDALRETLAGCLTSEFQTVAEILSAAQVATGDHTMAAQKITSRLGDLVTIGRAQKGEVVIKAPDGGKSRKLVAYALA